MKLGNCRLCQQYGELRFSHIFSEFLYQPTYDEKHKFISVSMHPGQKRKPFQKGFREYLLCQGCEQTLATYEDYSATLLRNADAYRSNNNKEIVIPNFDYQRLKLFGLSLLWRSHTSKLYFFQQVKLGPHAEKLRSMILSAKPGTYLQYPFSLHKIDGPEIVNQIIAAPTTARFKNHRAYVFLMFGFEWTFIVSSHYDDITDDYPFVGVLPELVILIERKTTGEFLHEVRTQIPKMTR